MTVKVGKYTLSITLSSRKTPIQFAREFLVHHPELLIACIKALRAEYGLTLKDAKDITDLARAGK